VPYTPRSQRSAHDGWYDRPDWRRRRAYQLAIEPVCRSCAARGTVTAADTVDHVVPHEGNRNAFVLGELQSLCKPCHNAKRWGTERRGYMKGHNADGWPTDPAHPVYGGGKPAGRP
jgi:5-methylcytosine-specific restriction enzyme A